MSLPITTIFASFIALWLLVLSAKVVDQRRSAKVGLGDGGNEGLTRRMRAMANFTEYTPFFLVMLVLAELQGTHFYWLAFLALLYFVSRLAHGYAMAFTENFPKGRFMGTLGTWVAIFLMALSNLVLVTGFMG